MSRANVVSVRRGWLLVAAVVVGVWAWPLGCSSEPSTEEFCEQFKHLLIVDELSLGVNPSDDAGTREAMDRTAREFADAAEAAPPEIRQDVQFLAELTAALRDAIDETSARQPFDRAAALIAAQDPFSKSLAESAQRVDDYVTRNCTAAPS